MLSLKMNRRLTLPSKPIFRRACALAVTAAIGLMAGCGGDSSTTSKHVTATTSVQLSVSPNPATEGADVTLTAYAFLVASCAPKCPGMIPIGSGTITFYDGSTSLGNAQIADGGVATLTVNTLAAYMPHQLTAVYAGDANHPAGTSQAVSLTINGKNLTSWIEVNLGVSPNPATPGADVTLSVYDVYLVYSCIPNCPGMVPVGSGTITFYDGSTPLGTAQFTGGEAATMTVNSLAANMTHQITAVYADNSGTPKGTSTAVPLTVSEEPLNGSATQLSVSPNPATVGDDVTLTANVYHIINPCTPKIPCLVPIGSGSVTFYDGSTSLGTAEIADGVATMKVNSLEASITHQLTAVYAGDADTAGSMSDVVAETIN